MRTSKVRLSRDNSAGGGEKRKEFAVKSVALSVADIISTLQTSNENTQMKGIRRQYQQRLQQLQQYWLERESCRRRTGHTHTTETPQREPLFHNSLGNCRCCFSSSSSSSNSSQTRPHCLRPKRLPHSGLHCMHACVHACVHADCSTQQ